VFLAISPQPLTFSPDPEQHHARSDADPRNTGDDVITVNGFTASAHFSAVGFAAVVLQPSGQPGSSSPVTIRFHTGWRARNRHAKFQRERWNNPHASERRVDRRLPGLGSRAGAEAHGGTAEHRLRLRDSRSSPTHTFALTSTGDIPVTVSAVTGPIAPYT